MPPATFRIMTILEDGRSGGNDSCGGGGSSTLQSLSGFSDDFESKFDIALHQDTKGFILEPGRKARVRIRFAPETVYNNFKQCKFLAIIPFPQWARQFKLVFYYNSPSPLKTKVDDELSFLN